MRPTATLARHGFRAANDNAAIPQGWTALLDRALLSVRRKGYRGEYLQVYELNAGMRIVLPELRDMPEVVRELIDAELDQFELESLWTCASCGVSNTHVDGKAKARTHFVPGGLRVLCGRCHRADYPTMYEPNDDT